MTDIVVRQLPLNVLSLVDAGFSEALCISPSLIHLTRRLLRPLHPHSPPHRQSPLLNLHHPSPLAFIPPRNNVGTSKHNQHSLSKTSITTPFSCLGCRYSTRSQIRSSVSGLEEEETERVRGVG